MRCVLLILVLTAPVFSQSAGDAWDTLNQEIYDLYDAGEYNAGIAVAVRALVLAEATVGPNHLDVATSLTNVADLFRVQGRYAKAEPLYKCALKIRERLLGPDHLEVAASLSDLALLYKYRAIRWFQEAEALEIRAAESKRAVR